MFEGRGARYVIGTALILVATVVSLAGVVAPAWLRFESPTTDNVTRAGLFMECTRSPEQCRPVNLFHIKGYEMWSHVLISMGIVALLISCVFIVFLNCGARARARASRRWKVVEGFASYGGVVMLIGIVNYVASDEQTSYSSYSYAFFLTLLAALLALAGGLMVAVHNRVPALDTDLIHSGTVKRGVRGENGLPMGKTVAGVSNDVTDT